MELILVRHGESTWSRQEADADPPLTELGREQARRLGQWLDAHYQFTAFYSSPLRRARETAEIVNKELGLDLVFDDDLREAEVNYAAAMPRRDGPLAEEADRAPFGAEYEQFRSRVRRALERIIAANPDGTVLVIAHGGTVATMVRCLLGVHSVSISTRNTGLHSLRWHDGRWEIRFMNRCEHLLPDLVRE